MMTRAANAISTWLRSLDDTVDEAAVRSRTGGGHQRSLARGFTLDAPPLDAGVMEKRSARVVSWETTLKAAIHASGCGGHCRELPQHSRILVILIDGNADAVNGRLRVDTDRVNFARWLGAWRTARRLAEASGRQRKKVGMPEVGVEPTRF
jgi:hypothetical protein